MANLVIPEIEPNVLDRLRVRANSHGRTPEVEAKMILHQALQSPMSSAWSHVDAIYQGLAESGRTFSDSSDLLREDRER